MTPETLRAVLAARKAGRPVVLATRLRDGAQRLLSAGEGAGVLQSAADLALVRDQNTLADAEGETWFLHVHAPAHRAVIVGAVHIAQSLAPLLAAMGLRVTVLDPRRGFNTPERFGDVERVLAWPDEGMAALAPDSRTAVVTLTHDPKLDDPALDAALRSQAFYIGALGSRRTHASRLERLGAVGHDAAALRRILGPAGLALGAVTSAEIALSIAAEIVAVRRGAPIAARR